MIFAAASSTRTSSPLQCWVSEPVALGLPVLFAISVAL